MTRNLCNRQIQKDKKNHIRSNLHRTKKEKKFKEYWGILLNLTGRTKSKEKAINLRSLDGELLNDKTASRSFK